MSARSPRPRIDDPAAPRDRPKRPRRTPDEARGLIVDAAERVFARSLPDVVGLKEVAREAGVSHALVTHYFGTYANLVDAVLEGKIRAVRESLMTELQSLLGGGHGDAASMLAAYRRALGRAVQDPVTIRLATWALISGRVQQEDFVVHRVKGLKLLADALEDKSGLARDDLEFCLIASFALTVTWALGRAPLSGALGRPPSTDHDEEFEAKSAKMIEGYLLRAEKQKPSRGQPRGRE